MNGYIVHVYTNRDESHVDYIKPVLQEAIDRACEIELGKDYSLPGCGGYSDKARMVWIEQVIGGRPQGEIVWKRGDW